LENTTAYSTGERGLAQVPAVLQQKDNVREQPQGNPNPCPNRRINHSSRHSHHNPPPPQASPPPFILPRHHLPQLPPLLQGTTTLFPSSHFSFTHRRTYFSFLQSVT